MRWTAILPGWLMAAVTFAGCATAGFRPTESLHDREFFAAPPEIVRRDGGYYVTWTQGRWPFYFVIDSKVIEGRFILVRGGSTSTGDRAGKPHEMQIRGAQRIAALEAGGAYWWEPDGSCVRLQMRDERTR